MSYLGRSAKLSLKAQEKVSFLATAGQTSKTGLSYTPTFVEVYVNGVLLTDTTDFTATNGNSVTFTVALLLNDEVTVVSLKTFTVADHYNKTEADTLLAAKSPLASPSFTGTVTADGLVVDGAALVRSGNALTLNRSDNAVGGAMSYVAGTGFIFNDANGDGTSFNVGAANRMRIESSGNVGIGTSSPASALQVSGAVANVQTTKGVHLGMTANSYASIEMVGASGGDGWIDFKDVDDTDYSERIRGGTGSLEFRTSGSEAMRIDSLGSVLVGTDSAFDAYYRVNIDGQGQGGLSIKTDGTGGRTALQFRNANGVVGKINTSGSATSYITSSDYRLKELDVPMEGATERVKALRPINFAWKVDGSRVDGFYAHELAEVVPEAATGTKDAMMDEEYEVTPATGDVFTAGSEAGFTEVSAAVKAEPAYYDVDGNVIKAEVIAQAAVHEAYEAVAEVIHSADVEQPETLEEGQQWRETTAQVMGTRSVPDMQGIDQSKLVPLLTATIQELIARIETLEGV
mgnify:CR=1 FL=1